MKKHILRWSYCIALLLAIASCNNDDSVDPTLDIPEAVAFVHEGMTEAYLWYKEVPASIRPEDYTDPIPMFEAMLFKPTDRWSILVKDNGDLIRQITDGTQTGIIGITVAYDESSNLRVVYALPDSPAANAGIQRSDIIVSINGTAPNPNQSLSFGETPRLEIQGKDGTVREVTLNRATIEENPVLHKEIIEREGMKIGYLVFNTFNGLAVDKLNDAFGEFKTAGIDELVVDLRYNGGGLVSASQHLGSLIVPKTEVGELFVKFQHNDKNSEFDGSLLFEQQDNNIGDALSRAVFLVTERTASASEMLINGLKPFMDVTIIGSNTNGKYTIASPFTVEDYTFIPVTSQGTNAVGNVFDGGFAPDINASDDIRHDFGAEEEEMLATALGFLSGQISGGRVSATTQKIEVLNHESYEGPAIKLAQ